MAPRLPSLDPKLFELALRAAALSCLLNAPRRLSSNELFLLFERTGVFAVGAYDCCCIKFVFVFTGEGDPPAGTS